MKNFISTLLICLPLMMTAQPNYDESNVPSYILPDPLTMTDGTPVSESQWKERRTEIVELFARQMYGEQPRGKAQTTFELKEADEYALEGKAIRKQVDIATSNNGKSLHFGLLLYLPAQSPVPVPVFLGLNFKGNHTIHSDPDILLTGSWLPDEPEGGAGPAERAKNRGARSSRWPVEEVIARGYGLATAYYGDIDPDRSGSWDDGIHPLFYEPGQSRPEADQWGAIGAWAWGLSKALDYLLTDEAINPAQVIVIGHSRLGKATLWAGATDERFSMVISNDSGCGGAALSRRKFGETVGAINDRFPHWFCDHFKQYNGKEEKLPFDQHMLLSLIAPRPLYVASASEDLWADPKGEFLAAKAARPVYELLGLRVDLPDNQPRADQPVVQGSIGYHLRSGEHDLTLYDWLQYMDFADLHFGR